MVFTRRRLFLCLAAAAVGRSVPFVLPRASAALSHQLVLRIAANIAELRRHLAQGHVIIEAAQHGMRALRETLRAAR